jgi:large subunit ribosomal protein L29
MSQANEIRELSDEALTHRIFDVERELVSIRFQLSMGALENTSQISILRKQIARIKGEARNREIAQGLRKGTLVQGHRASYAGEVVSAETDSSADEGGFLQGIVDKLTTKE